jgi:hypothetical protein
MIIAGSAPRLFPSPFKWGGVAVIRDGGVISNTLVPMTPPSAYDADTSPFEWGGKALVA